MLPHGSFMGTWRSRKAYLQGICAYGFLFDGVSCKLFPKVHRFLKRIVSVWIQSDRNSMKRKATFVPLDRYRQEAGWENYSAANSGYSYSKGVVTHSAREQSSRAELSSKPGPRAQLLLRTAYRPAITVWLLFSPFLNNCVHIVSQSIVYWVCRG